MSDSEAEIKPTTSPPASSHNSDQENEANGCADKVSPPLRLVAIEKLMAPHSDKDAPAVNGRNVPRRAAAVTKNASVIEITSSSGASSDDEVMFVPKASNKKKASSSGDEVATPASKPSSSRSSPVRESLKLLLKVPKHDSGANSSDEDSDNVVAKRQKPKHKSKRLMSGSSDEGTSLQQKSDVKKERKLKIALTKLPTDLKSFKEQQELDEIVSFAGKPIENLEEVAAVNGKKKPANDSDSDSDVPVAKQKGAPKKTNKMTNKSKTLTSSSESEAIGGDKKRKPATDEPSTSRAGRRAASASNSGSGDDSGDLTKMRPKRPTRAAKPKPAQTSDEEDQSDKEKSESDSDFEKKITKKSTVTKKRQRSESEDSFNIDAASDSASDTGKKSKKKKGSSSNSDSDMGPKKRRRIKNASSSDGSDNDKDSPNKGRKNIRKIVSKKSLEESTLAAAREERERKQRIEERQKIYNQLYSEKPEEVKVIDQLVLDFDEKTKKPIIEVDRKLVKKLKPHQVNGIRFMWDACFESVERMEQGEGSGCILGHCMGLGKTLQVITLIHTLMMNQRKTGIERVLVVCPINIILNWVNEFKVWMKHVEKGKHDIEVYELSKFKKVPERAYKLNEWYVDGGVMIIGYDMYRNLSNELEKKRGNKKVKEIIQQSLIDPGPDVIVCDEGHLLKNEKTSLSKAITKVRTLRRIVLTGTPLQNNLKEYYCMVQFVKPNLLGKYQEYMNRFVNPITNGQYTDSTDYDIKVMKRRAHVLHKMLDGCVQRRDYLVLAPYLPPKHEFVISIRLTKLQVKLYKYYMENKARQMDPSKPKRASILFSDFQNLQRIWTHPRVLRYNSDRYEQGMQKKETNETDSEGSLKDFIDDDSDESSEDSPISSDNSGDDSEASVKSKEKAKKRGRKRKTRAQGPMEDVVDLDSIRPSNNPTEWWMPLVPEEELLNIEHSGKLLVLLAILEECEAIGDKLLVFSQSLFSLDVIEHFLGEIDNQTQTQTSDGRIRFSGSWSLGRDYFRLDGSTPVDARAAACKTFNNPNNLRARLFLISTRAGGLGINLVAANRVVIFDCSWNPSHDTQSIFRVYRFGQVKPCYIYRFLALGTMEEKVYERQVTKQAIAKRVLDEQQIDRHYNSNDIQELYTGNVDPEEPRPLPALPKDRLFADILKKFELIYKYHEHDSLLENKEEETLSEEERKAAWEDYEYEKNKPQPAFNSGSYASYTLPPRVHGAAPVTSNLIFGIRSDILLRLLTLKARKDNPMFTNQEVQQYIPYLTQELYKQVQEGELTLRNELLQLQTLLEVPQYVMNANGVYVPNHQGQSNLMMNPYAISQMYQDGAGSSGMSRANQQVMTQQQMLLQRAQSKILRDAANKMVPITTIEID